MPLAHAQRIVNSKELDRIHQVGMDCVEAGWDGHKSIFG
jgi:hypothetical protein